VFIHNTADGSYDSLVKIKNLNMRKNTFNDMEGSVAINGKATAAIETCNIL